MLIERAANFLSSKRFQGHGELTSLAHGIQAAELNLSQKRPWLRDWWQIMLDK